VVEVIDVSRSNWQVDEATAKMEEVIDRGGPGDKFTLVRVAGKFESRRDVKVFRLKGVSPSLLEPARNYNDWTTRQNALTATWQKVESQKEEVKQALRALVSLPTEKAGGTDLWSGLQYVAFLGSGEAETYLYLCSDLYHQARGITSQKPPKNKMDFASAHIVALFVPNIWGTTGKATKEAWVQFFEQAGATSVQIIEAAQSPAFDDLLPPSGVLRLVPKDFFK
jgi:hypothetical protein